MRYGSIGWSVGATLGYAVAARGTGPAARVADAMQPKAAAATAGGKMGAGSGASDEQGMAASRPGGGAREALERLAAGAGGGRVVDVGAALAPKRVLALIGDGSFQVGCVHMMWRRVGGPIMRLRTQCMCVCSLVVLLWSLPLVLSA